MANTTLLLLLLLLLGTALALAHAAPAPNATATATPGVRVVDLVRVVRTAPASTLKNRALHDLDKSARRRQLVERRRWSRRGKAPAPADDGTATTTVNNCGDVVYAGVIELGTPPKKFTVILDTGSGDLWVAGKGCRGGCEGMTQYNPRESSTAEYDNGGMLLPPDFAITYLDGTSVQGTVVRDALLWGGFSLPRQRFAAVDEGGGFYACAGEDGLLGMAFDVLSQEAPTPFGSLVASGQLAAPVFAFSIGRDGTAGSLTLGGVDPSKFAGTLEYVDVAERCENTPAGETCGPTGFWEVDVSDVLVAGRSVASADTATRAIVDTGTSLILGPAYDVLMIVRAIPGALCYSYDDSSSVYRILPCRQVAFFDFAIVDCSSKTEAPGPDVAFTIGGRSYVLAAEDYELAQECASGEFEDCNGACWPKDYRDAWKGDGSCDDGQYGIDLNCPRHGCDGGDCGNCGDDNAFGPRCMVGFDQLWDQYWLFGDVFLRTVYTAYDWEKKRVGFAAQV